MPSQTIPGANVTYRPSSEALADSDFEWVQMPDGTIQGRKKPGWLARNAPWLTAAAMGAGFGVNALGLVGGGAASQGAAASGVLPSSQVPMSPLYTGPVVGGSQGISGLAAGAGSVAGAAGAEAARRATEEATRGLGGKALDALKDPKNLLGLAALIPALTQALKGGDRSASQMAVDDELSKSLALQRSRVEQTQPVFDTLVNMSYGSAPTRYRGNAPSGYPETAKAAPAGPYAYKGPRF